MTVSFLSDDWRKQSPEIATVADSAGTAEAGNPQVEVGEVAQDEAQRDALHEAEIAAAGRELEAAQALYEEFGCFNDAAARDIARDRFYALIRARSPAQAARMEKERGLA